MIKNLRRLKSFTLSTCGQMRLNNVALCHVHKAILDKLDIKKLMQEFVLRKDNRRFLFGNILVLCWLSRTFCTSGLMNGKNQQEAQQMQGYGSRNGTVGEVGLGRGTLGLQANTIWQWPTTTCLPSFISIRSAVLPEFMFLSNSGQKRRNGSL